MHRRPPQVFALPPGCDFAACFVQGFCQRFADQPPEEMARVTIYLNSERMRRRVTDVFVQHGDVLLPKLKLVTELHLDPRVRLPATESLLARKLQLSQAVRSLVMNQPDLAPRSAVFDLTDSLLRVLDEMQGEGIGPEALMKLDVSNHSKHWEKSKTFLDIIVPLFQENTGIEARNRRAVEQLSTLWAHDPIQDPILVVGSTGSRGTTLGFMELVSKLPKGALVLPGYDFDQPAAVWAQMSDDFLSEDHPQHRYRKLMDRLSITSDDFQPWTFAPPPNPARNRLVSLSLRPAPVTDQWLRDGPSLGDLRDATLDLAMLEASNPQEEAVAIALRLRYAADRNQTAALITPDRTLARRVTAALDRWGILPDDSAGKPLSLSPPGRLLLHLSDCLVRAPTAAELIALLKHPLVFQGGGRGEHLILTRELELKLRCDGPAYPKQQDLTAWAKDRSSPQAQNWAALISATVFASFDDSERPLSDFVTRHLEISRQLVSGFSLLEAPLPLWEQPAGEAAFRLMQGLQTDAVHAADMTAEEYGTLFYGLLHAIDVRESEKSDSRIKIWGSIESRVLGVDLAILGGLNDAVWPAQPAPDPWLNRKMRKDAGLLLPDRQIGLSAHDFQQSICAKSVLLTRSLRDSDAETIPSRWLNRLTNLLAGLPEQNGKRALDEMRAEGAKWVQLAQVLGQPKPESLGKSAASRPAPRPPVKTRPRRLPLTAVERLIRDPYEIYCKYILKLYPLESLRAEVDARDRGTLIHAILETFFRDMPLALDDNSSIDRLLQIAREAFLENIPFPEMRLLWLAKLERAARHIIGLSKTETSVPLAIEARGRLILPEIDFELYGTPDRIDRLSDGRLLLIDYKTGAAPTVKEQTAFAKQLLLAAAIAEEGGYAEIGPSPVARIMYVSLSGEGKNVSTDLTPDQIGEELARFTKLIASYDKRSTGYTARRALFKTRSRSPYDGLSRFGEWQMTDRSNPVYVGQEGDDEAK